jgi:hypothetical protein
MVKKRDEKEKIILEIVKQLKTIHPAQLVVMFQIIQMAGNVALQFSEAVERSGKPLGISMNLVRNEKEVELKS